MAFLSLNANEGVESCQKSECVDRTSLQEQLECVPCTSTMFLNSFLSRNPTNVTVALEYENVFEEIVQVTTRLTLYEEEATDKIASKGRKEDFIDQVVDVESLLSKAM